MLTMKRTVAITPSKAKAQDPELVRKVCQTWAIQGLKTMLEVNQNSAHPFRFLYMSGTGSMDPARPMSKDKKVWMPSYMVEYGKMRVSLSPTLFTSDVINTDRAKQRDNCLTLQKKIQDVWISALQSRV